MRTKIIGMKSLGLRNIGVRSVGCIGVPSSGGIAHKSLVDELLAKMKKEQPDLFRSLLLWYNPALQGITNKQLYDDNIEQGYSVLKDLSGNGYDARVIGMSGLEGDGHVNEDGQLVFDSLDDYTITDNIMRSIPMSLIFSGDVTSDRIGYIFSLANHVSMYYQLSNLRWRIAAFGQGAATINYNTTDNITDVVLISDGHAEINGTPRALTNGTMLNNIAQMRLMTSGANYAHGELHAFTLFSKSITEDEKQWLYNNFINIQIEQKQVTLNIYSADGAPYQSIKVNKGSQYKLTNMVVSPSEVANRYYYDIDDPSTEIDTDFFFVGDKDVNIYFTTAPRKDYILEKMNDEQPHY